MLNKCYGCLLCLKQLNIQFSIIQNFWLQNAMVDQSESSILASGVIIRTIKRSEQGLDFVYMFVFSVFNSFCLLYMCERSSISILFLFYFSLCGFWMEAYFWMPQPNLSCFLSPSVLYAGKDTSILCSDMIFPGNRESRHTESTSSPQDRWRERDLTEKEKGETGWENKRRMGSECENVKHLRGERGAEISTLERWRERTEETMGEMNLSNKDIKIVRYYFML